MCIGDREPAVIEVHDLTMGYNQAMVLHNIALHVEQGEQVFIVGRNGAGKTSLLKTLCGLIKPHSGRIEFHGQDIAGLSAEKIAKLGLHFVAQDKKVFSALTVKNNFALAAHAAGMDLKDAINKALSIYPKLEEFMELKAGNLSGGQREILLIGRAMIGEPKLLLIDEPTEGLAAKVIDDIFRILSGIKCSTSAIIVEQNLSVVTSLADRIYVMKEGKIIKEFVNHDGSVKVSDLEEYL
jgi:ABC-type branched-subunit amino acid transport system ATPase component